MISYKPHYRLKTDGYLYQWQGIFLGWEKVGHIENNQCLIYWWTKQVLDS